MTPQHPPREGAISIRERAEALAELVHEEAPASERRGRLSEEIAGALSRERLFFLLLPESAGGLGGTRSDLFEATEAMARADGSTAWCMTTSAIINFAAYRGLDADGRADVFGHGPIALWGSLLPNAASAAAPGGFRVSGKWTFGTGSSFAKWAFVSSVSKDAEGRNRYRAHLLPKEDVALIDGSWDTLGLRATSSVDFVIADRFVPEHRTYEYGSEGLPAAGPLSAMETVWLNQVGLTGFASGVGQRALAEFTAAAAKTKRISAEGVQAEDHVVQFGVGEMEGRWQAARSHYRELLARLEEFVARGEPASPPLRSQLTLASQTLARAARDAVLFAYEQSSSSIVYTGSPLQRCFRDLLTGLKHATFTPTILARVGKVRMGLPAPPRVL